MSEGTLWKGKAGISPKIRAIFRAIYKAASAFTTTQGADGKQIKSDIFSIDRGVLQGDVTSPLFFILALELILRKYDAAGPGKGISIMIHLLGSPIPNLSYRHINSQLVNHLNLTGPQFEWNIWMIQFEWD